jgi:uncharacterized membrane protein YgdD (TMEM256/DUF423 family)
MSPALRLLCGGLSGAFGVALAAYAAHGRLSPEAARLLGRAADMALWHAPLLLFLGLWGRGGAATLAALAALFGVILFSGSVAALGFGLIARTPLAPLGGTLCILAWLLTAYAGWRG